MYRYLGIDFQPISLTWIFTKTFAASAPQDPKVDGPEALSGKYFVYGKRLREMLLLSPLFWLGPWRHILQTIVLTICHVWFYAACFTIKPRTTQPALQLSVISTTRVPIGDTETFRQYAERIRVHRKYVSEYLLPVLSVICGCSHAEMLEFPASDVVNFMKGSFLQKTYVNRGGIHRVQSKLSDSLRDIRLRSRVTEVSRVDDGVLVCWEAIKGEKRLACEEIFDRVVLAVAPNVAAKVFRPCKAKLCAVPTAPVTSSIIGPSAGGISIVREDGKEKALDRCSYRRGDDQLMAFRTTFSAKGTQSESFHFLPNGLVVRTSPSGIITGSEGSLYTTTFTRTLRNSQSRSMMHRVMSRNVSSQDFGYRDHRDEGQDVWVNGGDAVWLAGSWCWDGLVILEGCVVSAMRVAQDFGVRIPWQDRVMSRSE